MDNCEEGKGRGGEEGRGVEEGKGTGGGREGGEEEGGGRGREGGGLLVVAHQGQSGFDFKACNSPQAFKQHLEVCKSHNCAKNVHLSSVYQLIRKLRSNGKQV